MGNELRYVCLIETRRLLLLMGFVFGLILFVQYFELSYSSILSSLLSTGKLQQDPIGNFRNLTYLSKVNSTDLNDANEASTTIKPSEEKNIDVTNVKDDFDDQENSTLNNDIDPEDDSPSKDSLVTGRNPTVERIVGNNSVPLVDNGEKSEYTSKTSALVGRDGIGEVDENKNKNSDLETRSAAKSSSHFASPENHEMSSNSENVLENNENLAAKEGFASPQPAVVTISQMNDMLLQSRVSFKAVKPRWSSTADQELRNAKSLIENASIVEKDPQFDVNLFRNFSEFKRSYDLMEQTLKVYTYAEGEKPIFHQPPLKGIYASEGWFMKLLRSNKKFATKNPKKAHLFYLPFSSRMLEVALYVPDSHNRDNLIERLETRHTMPNSIRALCNSDIKEGFKFGKDISLPETFVRSPQNPLRQLGGKPPSQRRVLAFFAGSMHGYLRPILLNHWENKDPDMKIFGHLRKVKGQMSYAQYMKSSKYCICAKGFEVNSPRVVEAIFYECVPVIISDNFVPPFFETLNWESFAVFVLEKDIPNLKSILLSISNKRYVEMQRRVKEVQKHFLWHSKPVNNPLKSRPSIGDGPSSSKPRIDPSSSKRKVVEVSIKNSAADSKNNRSTTNVSKMVKKTTTTATTQSKAVTKTVTKTREKKVFSLPGQKFDVPEEREPLRVFYESLSKQIPSSEMAEIWLMEHGMLSPDKAKKALEKKQRKQKQLRMGTPIKYPPPPASNRPESSKRPQPVPKNGEMKAKKRIVNDSDDDDDFVLSHKRRK
ncbi:probable glycosyltransferase at5g03795 [Phtheirospermum japonicum]|uniref:Probable glycosyltransferase at5g03795 n=1 Tax=Phtheirospermum japonicum TaxID=374723 RepID=A0A830CWQ9_9LAMI|nr:probable glycosyltransferase at5g03795 [Phtheirospermum japonicum]